MSARVVAATNMPLEAAVAAGTFRGDLFYRLAVVPVALPPLRERREDIEGLAREFLARHGSSGAEIAPEALESLSRRAWLGNARELENLLLRACALRPGLARLEASDIRELAPIAPTVADNSAASPLAAALVGGTIALPAEGISFEDVERCLLSAAWEQSGRHQTRGAKLLGLPRQAFIYRLQKFGLLPAYGEGKQEEAE